MTASRSSLHNVLVLYVGAGVSAESGVPTFRGAGGFWRTYAAQDMATLASFKRDPSLVWEFYHYRREMVLNKQPNVVREIFRGFGLQQRTMFGCYFGQIALAG